MFLLCFGRRRRSTSSIRDARSEPKMCEPQECISRNPFLIDLVIETMLSEAGVDTLKTLRGLNSNWNQLALKELRTRAAKGGLEVVDLSQDDCSSRIDEFCATTTAIPQLFQSFGLHLPNSFKSIGSSFSKYSPIYIHLKFNNDLRFTPNITQGLVKVFRWMSPTIQELKVQRIGKTYIWQLFNKSHLNEPPLHFPKLTKIDWDMGEDSRDLDYHIPFQFLLDKSGTVDPTPNLNTLRAWINTDFLRMMNHASIQHWSHLRSLTIFEAEDCAWFIATLLNLGGSGMCLKEFKLSCSLSEILGSTEMTRNLSQFFATQAQSLQVLELDWFFTKDDVDVDVDDDDVVARIQLPIFESLQTLKMDLSFMYSPFGPIETGILELGPFRQHFPKVIHLRVNEEGLLNILPRDGAPIDLKNLVISEAMGSLENWGAWRDRIQSVESLACEVGHFRIGKVQIPWRECLKILELEGVVDFALNINYLTSLEKVIVDDWRLNYHQSFDEYLARFQQVLALKLAQIKFILYDEPSDRIKAQFQSHFPFPAKFEQNRELKAFPF